MKILLFLFTTFILVATCYGQVDTQKGFYRTYHLPDGAILKGKVVGRLSKDSVVIETRDGLVYHLSSNEAKWGGRMFSPPQSNPEANGTGRIERPDRPVLPLNEQPRFQKGSSQLTADLTTHFSTGGSVENSESESGIVFSLSYMYGVLTQLKVGGGVGFMTVKSGSKERVVPVFVRGEYQILPRISATLSAGYGIIPTNDFVLNSENGFYTNTNIGFDLVGPESAYTSRIGVGLITQQLDLGRTEIIRENAFPAPRVFTQYVERSGVIKRLQITFTHAWRMPPATVAKRSKRKKNKR